MRKYYGPFIILILVLSLFRIIPGRPYGFAPQIAVALFSGSLFFDNKKLAFLMPLLSMFISDVFYEFLYINNMWDIPGFYNGQILNYITLMSIVLIGFITKNNFYSIIKGSIIGPVAYFLISNYTVWVSGGGYHRTTLMECYVDGLPFFKTSMYATLFFSFMLFGLYKLVNKKEVLNEQYR